MHASQPTPNPKFYYGWVIVAGSAAIGCSAAAIAGLNFGFFILPMSEELGISQAFIGWAFTARMVAFAASGFVIGKVLDRHGPRMPLMVAGAVAGLAIVGFSQIHNGWHLIALFIVIGSTGIQGAGANLYGSVPVAKWFRRKRGRAMALAFLGVPAGIFVFPALTPFLIDRIGWQSTWVVLGAIGGTSLFLIGLLVMRRQPQDYGLLPDGDLRSESPSPHSTGNPIEELEPEVSWTRAEALRSRTFWRLALLFGVMQFSTSTVGLFRVPYFIERGIDPQLVGFSFQGEAFFSVIAGIPVGFALDRYQARYIAGATLIPRVLAILVTMMASTAWHALAAASLNGLAAASFVVVQNAIWPSYFGSRHIGSIRGASMAITLTFAALGAPLTGTVHDMTGSYLPVWWVSVALITLAALMILRTPKPTHPSKVLSAG
jgi:MFS family permease